MFKIVILKIPVTVDETLLGTAEANIHKLSPEKILLAINIGCKCIADVEEVSKEEIMRLKMDLQVQQELVKTTTDKKSKYKNKLIMMINKLTDLKTILKYDTKKDLNDA